MVDPKELANIIRDAAATNEVEGDLAGWATGSVATPAVHPPPLPLCPVSWVLATTRTTAKAADKAPSPGEVDRVLPGGERLRTGLAAFAAEQATIQGEEIHSSLCRTGFSALLRRRLD